MITGFNWGQQTFHPKTLEFLDLLGAGGGKIGLKRALGIDRLIKDLYGIANPAYTTYDLWTSGKLRAVYPMIGGNANCHKWNLLDLRDDDSAYRLTFAGSPDHNEYGMDGRVMTTAYAKTYLYPSAVLSQNDQSYGVFSQFNDNGYSGLIGGSYMVGSNAGIYLDGNNKIMTGYVNNMGATNNRSLSSKKGFFMVKRNSDTHLQYVYDSIVDNITFSNQPITPREILIGRFQNGNNNYVCSFACIGHYLTDAEALFLDSAVRAYNNTVRPL